MFRAMLLSLACLASAQTRFGREILEPAVRSEYAYTKIDEFDAPALSRDDVEATCLAYRDQARLYLEIEIRNGTARDIDLPKDFVSVEQTGRKLTRTRTAAVARDIETEAIRPFAAKQGEPVDAQAKRHLQRQEQGIAFASLLETFAQEAGPAVVPAKEDHTVLCTFEAPRAGKDPLSVTLRLADREFRFVFRPRAGLQ